MESNVWPKSYSFFHQDTDHSRMYMLTANETPLGITQFIIKEKDALEQLESEVRQLWEKAARGESPPGSYLDGAKRNSRRLKLFYSYRYLYGKGGNPDVVLKVPGSNFSSGKFPDWIESAIAQVQRSVPRLAGWRPDQGKEGKTGT